MKKKSSPAYKSSFPSMLTSDVPRSRNGKHRQIVSAILADLDELEPGSALKIPLTALHDTKENVRSALSRETKKRKLTLATAADQQFLYVWRDEPAREGPATHPKTGQPRSL